MTALCLLGPAVSARAEKQPGPAMKLSLDALGYSGVSTAFLDTGASMLTLHFMDDQHLLLTYSERGLVPREKDDPKEDEDRVVAGLVVELPSGKVVARTEWHMHDHGRYLWNLGRGRFLMRIRDSLYTMAPLARLKQGSADPFERTVLINRGVRPTAVFVSADKAMLTLETTVKAEQTSVLEVSNSTVEMPLTTTLLDFFRIEGDGSDGSALELEPVAHVKAPQPFFLPIDATGYVWPVETGNNKWTVTFDDFSGKTVGLGTLDSSCTPRIELLDAAEYLALTCRGNEEQVRMASYGFDAQETWQEDVGDFGPGTFGESTESSRFVVSHLVTGSAGTISSGGGPLDPAQPQTTRQELRVYQNASGDLLLKTDCTPTVRSQENFDLSEDGTMLAAVKDGSIAIYKLPPLSKRDKEDIAELKKFTPPVTSGSLRFALLAGPSGRRAETRAVVAPELPGKAQAGDVPAALTHRKPPTLLLPGEKPEFGKSNNDGSGELPQ